MRYENWLDYIEDIQRVGVIVIVREILTKNQIDEYHSLLEKFRANNNYIIIKSSDKLECI